MSTQKELLTILTPLVEKRAEFGYTELTSWIKSKKIDSFEWRDSTTNLLIQVEIEAFWEEKANGPIRLLGSISRESKRRWWPFEESAAYSIILKPD